MSPSPDDRRLAARETVVPFTVAQLADRIWALAGAELFPRSASWSEASSTLRRVMDNLMAGHPEHRESVRSLLLDRLEAGERP